LTTGSGRLSYPSGPAEADRDLPVSDDHRNPALRGYLKKFIPLVRLLQQIHILKFFLLFPESLTGLAGKESAFFSVNDDHKVIAVFS
jgi:hypothetical protein